MATDGTRPGGAGLADRKCVPCEGTAAPLGRAECERLLAGLAPGWRLASDGKSLHHDFKFRDFYRAMSFVNCIAHLANLEDHHPDLAIGYGYVHLSYTSHAIKGLSENDFICAAKIDRIPLS
jgi:4a-hydroxytetrahydrobiopterin dehydratase